MKEQPIIHELSPADFQPSKQEVSSIFKETVGFIEEAYIRNDGTPLSNIEKNQILHFAEEGLKNSLYLEDKIKNTADSKIKQSLEHARENPVLYSAGMFLNYYGVDVNVYKQFKNNQNTKAIQEKILRDLEIARQDAHNL